MPSANRHASSPVLLGEALWKRQDQPSFDHCRVVEVDQFYSIKGCVLTTLEGRPYRVEYTVSCDRSWSTRALYVEATLGLNRRRLRLERDPSGAWSRDRTAAPDLDGLIDIDLAITPATNTLPIRRLDLAIGSGAEVEAAWVQFPDLSVQRLPQRYSRTSERDYQYESGDGGFAATLEVGDNGIVVRYGDLWERIAP